MLLFSKRLLELLIPLEPRTQADKVSHTSDARETVVDEAFQRCLTELEREVLNDEYTKQQAIKQQNAQIMREAKKKEENLVVKKELNDYLDAQVHEFEAKKEKERFDRTNAQITTIIEGNSGAIIHSIHFICLI